MEGAGCYDGGASLAVGAGVRVGGYGRQGGVGASCGVCHGGAAGDVYLLGREAGLLACSACVLACGAFVLACLFGRRWQRRADAGDCACSRAVSACDDSSGVRKRAAARACVPCVRAAVAAELVSVWLRVPACGACVPR